MTGESNNRLKIFHWRDKSGIWE